MIIHLVMLFYLECVENGIEGMTAHDLFNRIFNLDFEMRNNVMVSDLIQYLPDIKHFVKNGHKCANICDIECTYCKKCGEKVAKIVGV